MNRFLANWKTTANGILAFLIATATTVMAFTAMNTDKTNLKIAAICNIVLALCRAYVGLLQKDADKVIAKVPGISDPVVVDATPVPVNPKAKLVETSPLPKSTEDK